MNRRRRILLGGAVPTYLPTALGTPYMAFGVKKLISAYAGSAIQGATTATAGGGSTADIGFTASGKIDAAAITSNSVIATNKWYDQSGNGRDMTNNGVDPRPYVLATQTGYSVTPIQFGGVDTLGPSEQNLQTVNTLSVNRRAMTVYMVLNPRVSLAASSWFEYRTAAARQLTGVIYNGQSGFYTANEGFGLNDTLLRPRAQLSVLAISSSASGIDIYLRGQKVSFAAYGVSTIDQLVLGQSGIGVGWGFRGDCFAHVTYASAHTESEVNTVISALTTAFNVPTSFTSRAVFVGDSITQGIGTLRNMVDQLGLAGAELYNLGLAGETAAQGYAARASREGALYTAAYGAKNCVCIYGHGINDIINDLVADGAALYTIVDGHEAYGAGLGYKTVVRQLTVADFLTAPRQTKRGDYNTLVAANSMGATATALTASTIVAGDTMDSLHPKQSGYALLAPVVKSAIQTAMA